MTNFLVKCFIKDKDNITNNKVRTAYGILASLVGITCNIFLFLLKLVIGLLLGSISVTADAFNNLSDAASSVIAFIGVKLAELPADKEHPFGHGRFEYIAALVVAFLVIQVGFSCFQSSFSKILKPEQVQFQPVLILVLLLPILLKIWLGLFNRKLGRRINSAVMKATAADSFGDVLITSMTIVSVLISQLTGLKVDGYIGIVVSILVILSGINIAKDTLEPLLGEAVPFEIYDRITKLVESYDEILGTHDLIVHNYGPSKLMATIHAEVANTSDFEKIHELIDQIEREVYNSQDIFLVIHMDPIEVDNKKVVELKKKVEGIINRLEKNASIHDFRMVNGELQANLIFDLVIPFGYSGKTEDLLCAIKEEISKEDPKYVCVITIEHSFIAEKREK